MNTSISSRLAVGLSALLACPAAGEPPSAEESSRAGIEAYQARCGERPETEECAGLREAARQSSRDAIVALCEERGSAACVDVIAEHGVLLDPEERAGLLAALKSAGKPRAAREPEAPVAGGEAFEEGLSGVRDAVGGARPGGLDGLFEKAAARGAAAGPEAVGVQVMLVDGATPALQRGLAGTTDDRRTAVIPVPRSGEPRMSAREPSLGERFKDGGLRVVHAGGAVLGMIYEGFGSAFQSVHGWTALAAGRTIRAAGGAAEELGSAAEQFGRSHRAPRLAAAGRWTRERGLETSDAGSLTAGEGAALVAGAPVRFVNGVLRPVTALIDPKVGALSTAQGRTGAAAAAAVRTQMDPRFTDLGASPEALAARGHTDAMLEHKIDTASKFKDPAWRAATYIPALLGSAADKATHAVFGGGAAKAVGGAVLHAFGLGSMAAGTVEQGLHHAAEISKAKTPEDREAAKVKALKGGTDTVALLGAGAAEKGAGERAPSPAAPAAAAPRSMMARVADWFRDKRQDDTALEVKAERAAAERPAGPADAPRPGDAPAAPVRPAGTPPEVLKALFDFKAGKGVAEEVRPALLKELENRVELAGDWGTKEDLAAARSDLRAAREAFGVGDGEAALAGVGGGAQSGGRRPMTPREENMRAVMTESLLGYLETPEGAKAVDRVLAGETSIADDKTVRARLEAGERPSVVLADMLEAAARDKNGDILRFQDMDRSRIASKLFADDAVVHNGEYAGERTVDHIPANLHEFVHRLGFGERKAHELQALLFGALEERRLAVGAPAEPGKLRGHNERLVRDTAGLDALGMADYLRKVGYSEEALSRHAEDRAPLLRLKLMEEGRIPDYYADRYPQESLAALREQHGRLSGDPLFAKETAAFEGQIRSLERQLGLNPEPPSAEALAAYRAYAARHRAGSNETLTPELGRTISWLLNHPEFRADQAAVLPGRRAAEAAGRISAAKEAIARALGTGRDPKAALVGLEDVGPLAAGSEARGREVADLVRGVLGLDGELEVRSPSTDPLSGEQVYLLAKDGAPVAVAKVFRSGKAADVLARELAAGEVVGRLGAAQARPVATKGAFRAGPGEYVQIMEAAPGRDFYAALRSVGQAAGAEARGRALAEVRGETAAVARAMGELHRLGAGDKPGAANAEYDVSSAKTMLGALDGAVAPDLHAALKDRVETLGASVLATKAPGAVTHGDAHPGNFFVGKDAVTMIDMETVMYAVGPDGRGVGNPAADIARFTGAMRLNNAAKGLNLTERELAALEREFIGAYSRESGIPYGTLARDAEFYKVRLGLSAMTFDPANRAHYETALRAMLSEKDGGKP